jgi:arginine exporter protein ArgO
MDSWVSLLEWVGIVFILGFGVCILSYNLTKYSFKNDYRRNNKKKIHKNKKKVFIDVA